jgi:lipoprotein-anchoring transpeptidase ErfK/SrfK
MNIIRFLSLAAVAATLLFTAPHAFAQGREMNIGDQPGYVPRAKKIDPEYRRTAVLYRTTEAPGTIIINTSERFLYLIQGNGRALRYGIGVGREGFQWQGLQKLPASRSGRTGLLRRK